MTTILEAALFYATRKNFAVFPLAEREKLTVIKSPHPKGFKCRGECGKEGHGLYDAVKDPEHIKHWYTNGYSRCNIGIRMGAISGVVALDVDPAHGGAETLAALEEKHGKLPVTPKVITGTGGNHYFFAHPGIEISNSQGEVKKQKNGTIKVTGLGAGLDFRGDGGYVVAAPSVHPNGNTYHWSTEAPLSLPFAPMPLWMVEILTKQVDVSDTSSVQRESGAVQTNGQDENVYPKGTRHAAMVSLAGTMRKRGMTEAAILAAILEEAKRFVPPATAGDIEALKLTVTRVCNYEPTAALATAKPGRVQVDWAFCKSMFEFPVHLADFEWLKAEWLGDRALAEFWKALLETRDPIAAATRSGTLLDLQAWDNFQSDRIDAYAKEIANYGYLDGVVKAAENIQRMAFGGDLSKLQDAIQVLADHTPHATIAPEDANTGLDELAATLESGSFIKTGLAHIDNSMGGLEDKAMSILAARPSMGKTTLAWQIARCVALNERVLFFSLEVANVKLWRKAALGLAGVSPSDIFNKKVSDHDLNKIYKEIIPHLKNLYQGRLFMYDQVTDLRLMWRMAQQLQPALIVVDHLRYVDDDLENEIKRLGNISKGGKQLVKKIGGHIMFVHQLSRAVTSRDDKAPQLTDLRESGHVEENADQVFMIHRPDYYDLQPEKKRYSETQLIVRKNRDDIAGVPYGMYYDLKNQWFYRQDELPPNYRDLYLDGKRQEKKTPSGDGNLVIQLNSMGELEEMNRADYARQQEWTDK